MLEIVKHINEGGMTMKEKENGQISNAGNVLFGCGQMVCDFEGRT
jgi:hypothetical protein